jgi:outer membrane protein assembly factor BamB
MGVRHRRGILLALFYAVNATACAPTIPKPAPVRQETTWPAYLASPRHDAFANETLNPDPRPQWQTDVGHAVRGSPALGEAVMAVGATDRIAVLLDRATGEVHWRQRLAGTVHAGPLLDSDRLYVATEATPESRVYALRLRDGRPLWSTRATGVQAPLALDGAALFAAGEDGTVLRLDAESGRTGWRRRLTGAIRAAPVPTPHGLLVATTADSVFLLDQASGTVRARAATPGAVVATPALAGGRVFLATTAGRVMELELPSLATRWTHETGEGVHGALALDGDTLQALARDGGLWLIPIDAPLAARVVPLGVAATAGPTPVAAGILIGTVSGEVLLVHREDGKVLWRASVDGPIEQPLLVRDRQLVVVGGRGDIHTYR